MKTIAREPGQSSHRARVGMIGLAAVLLLIGLAAAIFSLGDHGRPGVGRTSVSTLVVADNGSDAAKEPLAELGVAPSATGDAAHDDNRTAPTPLAP